MILNSVIPGGPSGNTDLVYCISAVRSKTVGWQL